MSTYDGQYMLQQLTLTTITTIMTFIVLTCKFLTCRQFYLLDWMSIVVSFYTFYSTFHLLRLNFFNYNKWCLHYDVLQISIYV